MTGTDLYSVSAKYGNLSVCQWAKANGYCDLHSTATCEAAAEGGYLEILQWARANDFFYGLVYLLYCGGKWSLGYFENTECP